MKEIKNSSNNPIEVDFIEAEISGVSGRIAMSIAPGKKDEEKSIIWDRDLATDLKRLSEELSISGLVCLLEDEEMDRLQIPSLLSDADAVGIQTIHSPVPDEEKPSSVEDYARSVKATVDLLREGKTVLMHCKGGRGRTGMHAASCLVELGMSADEAIATVRKYRDKAVKADHKVAGVKDFAAYIAK